jgi:hypothetical protein
VKFSVVLPRLRWWRCLEDIADCLAAALKAAGHEVWRANDFAQDHAAGALKGAIEIVIGAHREGVVLPNYPVIIYQTEVPGSGSFPASYVEKLSRALCVWDSAHGYGTGLAVVEPGRYEQTPADVPKDIDILFYGSLTERRVELLTKLQDAGLNPECHFNVFGAERNALVDRAKVIVDIKQRESDPSDKTRTFFLDSRGACVLTENDTDPLRRLSPARIVEQCRALLNSAEARRNHVAERRAELKPTDVTDGIAVLARALAARVGEQPEYIAHHPV